MKTKVQLIISVVILLTVQLIAQVDSTATENDSSKVKEYLVLESGKLVYGKIDFNKGVFSGSDYFMLDDSTRYEATDVKAFQDEEGYFAKVFEEDDFVKRESKGKLDLYSGRGHGYVGGTPITSYGPNGVVTTYTPSYGVSTTISYFSKNGGKVLVADYDNLKDALKDNAKSMELLNEWKTLQYVKYGAAVVALGLVASSFIGVDENTKPNFGLAITGAVIGNLGYYIPGIMQSGKIQKSIKVYNGLR